MAIDQLKKHLEILNKHLDFVADWQTDKESEQAHLDEIFDTLSDLVEAIEAAEAPADGADAERISSLQAEVENLKKALEEARAAKETVREVVKEVVKEVPVAGAAVDEKKLRAEIEGDLKKEFEMQLEKLRAELATAKAGKPAKAAAVEKTVEKPKDPKDLEAWQVYLEQNPADEDGKKAILALEKEARAGKKFVMLADVLVCKVNFGYFANQEEEFKILEEIADIQELEVGDVEQAFHAVLSVFEARPSMELVDRLTRLAQQGNLWEMFVGEMQQVLEPLRDDALRSHIWLSIARAYNERLKRTDYAITALKKALDYNPKSAEALDDMASIHKNTEQWEDLVKTLQKRLKLSTDNDEKAYYLREIAAVQKEQLKEPFLAAATYEEVFTLAPHDPESIAVLESIYRGNKLWEQLGALLNRKVEYAESADEARNARRELGFLYAHELNDTSKAIDILEHVLEVMHDDVKLLRQLLELYEKTGRMRGYLKTARILVDETPDIGEKINLLKRMAAEWRLTPSTRANAAECYEKIIELRFEEEDVYDSLEDIYAAEEQWDALAMTLNRHTKVVQAEGTKAQLLRRLGEVLLTHLEDPKGAVPVLEESLALRPKNVDTVKLAAKAYELTGELENASIMLEQLCELLEDETQRTAAYGRLGHAYLQLNKIEQAEGALQKALAANENDFKHLAAMGDVYRRQEQWTRAASYYERAMKASKNQKEQGEVVFTVAEIYADRLHQAEKAVALYEEFLSFAPGHPTAVRVLANHYFEKGMWEKAAPLLHVLVTESAHLSKPEQVALHLKAGRVALKVADIDRAAMYLEKARELDPTSLEVLMELAELRYRKEEWDGSLSLYQALLVAHRDALSPEKVAEIYCRLGGIKERKGDQLKAVAFYDKALEANHNSQEAAEAVLRLREAHDDYAKLAKIKLNKINAEPDIDKKLDLYAELIRFYLDTVKDPDKAVEMQEKALALRPDDRELLSNAMDLYHLVEQWDKVVATILKLAHLEEPGMVRSKYHYSAGLIYSEEIGDHDSALEQFEICLDQDAENDEVFFRILDIHRSREDWHNLTRAMRRQLKRNPENRMNFKIWEELGQIYRERLGDHPTAVAAFEFAANLNDTPEQQLKLAEIYIEAGPDYLDKAGGAYEKLLYHDPQNVEMLRRLLEIQIARQNKDRTWILCTVLDMFHQASEKEKIFAQRYSQTYTHAKSILTDDLWTKTLQSPDESQDINKILSGLGHHLSLYYALPHKDYGLDRKKKIDLDADRRAFCQAYSYVSKTLLITAIPELFAREGLPLPIQLANTKEGTSLLPSWLIEERKFAHMSEQEAAYNFARELVFLRPERLFRRAAPAPTDLFNSLYAAFAVLSPDKPPKFPAGREAVIEKLAAHIKEYVSTAVLESLKPVASRVLQREFEPEITRWIHSNHRTSLRAATLIGCDIRRVVAWVLAEPDNITGMVAKDRIKEVLRFVISAEYAELRAQLGLTIS
ncbi:MAG: hypothetical protein CVU59_03790 [Deltaproteobacteria bacterium HGW-Deltaproteobacteria-17]|nr:MAG: hypothetical protein CVU59_03790 [Deltaproteobacteria bacterium HGW-Deltaproteobacteria-17]